MARKKKIVIQEPVSRTAAEEAFAEYAKADHQIDETNAKIDIQCTKIREKYADKLADLEEIREKQFAIMEKFAQDGREELFTKRRSIAMSHGILGFRTGTPKLATLRGFTWAAVTNLLEEFLPEYVKSTVVPQKDKLIADRDVPEVNILFKKVGIEVKQDETFFVEPKKEEKEAA